MQMAGAILLLIGAVIFFVSSLGLVRMPDVYNRIQTGTKATTLATILVMIGISLLHPIWAPKLLILVLFILLTNPISSHVVARSAHFNNAAMSDKTVDDQLKSKKEGR